MGIKLLWTGLVFMIALTPVLKSLGADASDVLILVGAVISVIGLILLWMDK